MGVTSAALRLVQAIPKGQVKSFQEVTVPRGELVIGKDISRMRELLKKLPDKVNKGYTHEIPWWRVVLAKGSEGRHTKICDRVPEVGRNAEGKEKEMREMQLQFLQMDGIDLETEGPSG